MLIYLKQNSLGFLPLESKDVEKVNIPTLLINGEHSPKFLHRFNKRLNELLSNSKRVIIPKASHIVHEDNPEAFNEEVMNFLG